MLDKNCSFLKETRFCCDASAIQTLTLTVSCRFHTRKTFCPRRTDVRLKTGGFQLLHAVYVVEYFLQGLIQRKCNFHIVFFGNHKDLCLPRGVSAANKPKYMLARAAIQRHLSVNIPKSQPTLVIHSFASIQDTAFQEYLRATGVYFVMCHDGANPLPLPVNDEKAQTEIAAQETSRKVAFRQMICQLISQSYSIALINGLEWADTKVSCAFAPCDHLTDSLRVGYEHGCGRQNQSKI